MNLTRLQVLVAVRDTGSVTAAAASLDYAQPSVSHHLARLEQEMGVALVRRVGRGIVLTDAGRVLAARAEEILGRISAARTEVAAHAELRTGRIRLAAFPSALATIVPDAAAAFAARHPGVDLALTEAEPSAALIALRRDEVDVALIFEHGEAAPPATSVRTESIMTEPVYVVVRKSVRVRGRRNDLRSYAGDRWIAGCVACREHLVASCAAAGFEPSIRFETDDYVAAQALVAAGSGVTTLPGLALLAHRSPQVRIDVLPGQHRRVLMATYGRPPSPAPVEEFLTVLRQADAPRWPS